MLSFPPWGAVMMQYTTIDSVLFPVPPKCLFVFNMCIYMIISVIELFTAEIYIIRNVYRYEVGVEF